LRYYVPEIAKIFRIKLMPRNRVQHQKGLSDDAFERLYPDEEACRKVTNIIDALLTTACIFVIANRLTD